MAGRIWTGDASMKYPKKWIVMVNLNWEQGNKLMGEVYSVKDTREEARAIRTHLGESMGKTALIEGFDETPQIGGLWG